MKITKFIAEILTVMVAMAGGGKSTIALGEPPPLPIQSVYFSFSPVNNNNNNNNFKILHLIFIGQYKLF